MTKNLALIALALLVSLCMLLAQACAPATKAAHVEGLSLENKDNVNAEINEFTKLAYEGGTLPLTPTPVVGTPNRKYNSTLKPGTEPLDDGYERNLPVGAG